MKLNSEWIFSDRKSMINFSLSGMTYWKLLDYEVNIDKKRWENNLKTMWPKKLFTQYFCHWGKPYSLKYIMYSIHIADLMYM